MLARSRTHRPGALHAAILAGLVGFPLVVTVAVTGEQAGKAVQEAGRSPNARVAILRGRVTDEAGSPLADVRVRVAIPSADMRFVHAGTDHKQMEARSDARGDYTLEIPGLAGRTNISIDAMKPGYRRLVGTPMAGGDPKSVEVAPGEQAEASLILKPALYFSGMVVDERGRPIPAVEVTAKNVSPRSLGYIERTVSHPDGSFKLFCYPVRPAGRVATSQGTVSFFHPDYVDAEIEDVYASPPEERTGLRVVLPTGYKVTGTVLDVGGKPVPKVMVKAIRKAGDHRKTTLTDANGKFALRGLSGGLTELSVRALDINQRILVPMALNGDKNGLEIRLKPISLPDGLVRYSVLGMQLADMTPELKSAFDVFNERGALIVDPGKDFDRLKIGELAPGNVFWLVGDRQIGSVREFVDQILAETAGQNAEEYSVRVVYTYSRVEFDGTSTQYLRLTKDDRKQLKILSDRLTPETP